MVFAHPEYLWLLTALPLLWVWSWICRRRTAVRFPALAVLARLSRAGRWRQACLMVVRTLVLVLIIVGLSRPRIPDPATRVPFQSRALVLVLDVSGSMTEPDFQSRGRTCTRLDAAKEAFQAIVRENPDDLVGLITFAARSQETCPPTLSHGLVRRMWEAAQPVATPPESSTNIGDSLAEAIDLIGRTDSIGKLVVLVSDGEHNVPGNVVADALKPRQAARLAQALGIRVCTIYVGPSMGRDAKEQTSILKAREALEDVAMITGGRAFVSRDDASMAEAIRDISRLGRPSATQARYVGYREFFSLLGETAVVLMFLSLWLLPVR